MATYLSVDCESVELLASLYFHKALEPEEMEAFDHHLEQCTHNCRRWVDDYAREVGVLLTNFEQRQSSDETNPWDDDDWGGADREDWIGGSL